MDFSKITRTDYSKINEFKREDYNYRKFKESANYILWEVSKPLPGWKNSWNKYELWRKRFVTNPGNEKVARKLNDEDGGKSLWFFNNWEDFKRAVERQPEKFPEEVFQICHQWCQNLCRGQQTPMEGIIPLPEKKNSKKGDTIYGFSISQMEAWEKLH